MKIILTGAAGFIGSCYLRKLNDMGLSDVWIVDTPLSAEGVENLQGKKFKDYLSREDLLQRISREQFKDVDVIVHMGACSDTTEMDRAFLKRNNFEYSQTLALWALTKGKRFHYASSASVYGDGKNGYQDDDSLLAQFKPLNPYAESKHAFDSWLIHEKLTNQVVGFRYFNVFGPNEYHKGDMRSMVCKAVDQINKDGAVKLFATTRPGYPDGSEERDFVYVKDVNEVMAYFLEHPDKNGIFNVGSGKARSFKDLMLAVFSALGKEPVIQYIPMPERLKGQYQYFTEADLSKLRSVGYNKPFLKLEESVGDYVKNHLIQQQRIY
ncbi:MAG: ADP-L-glycero-D-manno-heptose-6-epimerase [Elusimicrobia bacterium]|nr:ADP-L-glycero-D-manno-heptose-6-epimerase [Elusimicrobiota bacterium]